MGTLNPPPEDINHGWIDARVRRGLGSLLPRGLGMKEKKKKRLLAKALFIMLVTSSDLSFI